MQMQNANKIYILYSYVYVYYSAYTRSCMYYTSNNAAPNVGAGL